MQLVGELGEGPEGRTGVKKEPGTLRVPVLKG